MLIISDRSVRLKGDTDLLSFFFPFFLYIYFFNLFFWREVGEGLFCCCCCFVLRGMGEGRGRTWGIGGGGGGVLVVRPGLSALTRHL